MSGRRAAWATALGLTTMVAACDEPTSADGLSSFTADVTGATTVRLTGTATASAGSDWSRESVVQVTLPNAGTFSGIVLSATGATSSISFMRSGAELAMGAFRVGRYSTSSLPAGGYTAGYVVRQENGLKIFAADSGTVSVAEAGNRVSGGFTLYVSAYDVFPFPTVDQVGKPITPLSSGRSPLTITGTFNAAKR